MAQYKVIVDEKGMEREYNVTAVQVWIENGFVLLLSGPVPHKDTVAAFAASSVRRIEADGQVVKK